MTKRDTRDYPCRNYSFSGAKIGKSYYFFGLILGVLTGKHLVELPGACAILQGEISASAERLPVDGPHCNVPLRILVALLPIFVAEWLRFCSTRAMQFGGLAHFRGCRSLFGFSVCEYKTLVTIAR